MSIESTKKRLQDTSVGVFLVGVIILGIGDYLFNGVYGLIVYFGAVLVAVGWRLMDATSCDKCTERLSEIKGSWGA